MPVWCLPTLRSPVQRPLLLPDLPGCAVVSSKPGLLSDANFNFSCPLPPNQRAISFSKQTNPKRRSKSYQGTARLTFHLAEIETRLANSCQRSDLHPPLSHLAFPDPDRGSPPAESTPNLSPHRRPALLPSRATHVHRAISISRSVADSQRHVISTRAVLFSADAASRCRVARSNLPTW